METRLPDHADCGEVTETAAGVAGEGSPAADTADATDPPASSDAPARDGAGAGPVRGGSAPTASLVGREEAGVNPATSEDALQRDSDPVVGLADIPSPTTPGITPGEGTAASLRGGAAAGESAGVGYADSPGHPHAAFISDLLDLADFLAVHPELPTPYRAEASTSTAVFRSDYTIDTPASVAILYTVAAIFGTTVETELVGGRRHWRTEWRFGTVSLHYSHVGDDVDVPDPNPAAEALRVEIERRRAELACRDGEQS